MMWDKERFITTRPPSDVRSLESFSEALAALERICDRLDVIMDRLESERPTGAHRGAER